VRATVGAATGLGSRVPAEGGRVLTRCEPPRKQRAVSLATPHAACAGSSASLARGVGATS
jgi:hypothetical protein